MGKKEQKGNNRIKWISLFVVVCAILLTLVGIKMIQENGKCIDRPFQYSAQKLKESGGNYICICKSQDPQLLDFTFNETDITIIQGGGIPIQNFK